VAKTRKQASNLEELPRTQSKKNVIKRDYKKKRGRRGKRVRRTWLLSTE